jgi:hypothetical protein
MEPNDFQAYFAQLSRLLRLSRGQRNEIRRELASHVQEAIDDLIARGVPREQALRQVLDDFGDAAELAARFRNLGRKRRWVMHGTVMAACIGLAAIGMSFFATPGNPPAGSVGDAVRAQAARAGGADVAKPEDPIHAALQKKANDVSFENLPLEQVIEWITEITGVNTHVQWQALENAGIARDAVVSLRVKNVSIERVLRLVLDDLGAVRLDYEVVDGVLLLSTREALHRNLTTRVYDVRDLLHAIGSGAVRPRFRAGGSGAKAPSASGGSDTRFAGAMGGDGADVPATGDGSNPLGPSADDDSSASELIELLYDMVAPDSWVDRGGQAQAQLFHGALVVRQTQGVHRELDELIRELRGTLVTAK